MKIKSVDKRIVKVEDIDNNGHMNNARYVAYFEDAMRKAVGGRENGMSFLRGGYCYRMQAYDGDKIKIFTLADVGESQGKMEDIRCYQKMLKGSEVIATARSGYGRREEKWVEGARIAEEFERERRRWLEERGFGPKTLSREELGFFVVRAFYQEMKEMKRSDGDKDSIEIDKAKVRFHQKRSFEGRYVGATVTYVFVDLKSGRIIRDAQTLVNRLVESRTVDVANV